MLKKIAIIVFCVSSVILANPPPLTVSISPMSKNVDFGGSVTFNATPSGGSGNYTTYQWQTNNGNGIIFTNVQDGSGSTTANYTISPVAMGDAGQYQCVVTDDNSDVGTSDPATLTVNPPTYSITYSGNNNTGGNAPSDPNIYATGATVTVLGNTGNLVRTGYTFSGWNSAADGSGTTYGATFTMGTSSVTLYAKWTLIPTYTVTYNGNGNTGGTVPTDPGAYVSGATVTAKTNSGNLSITGYSFTGWNTLSNGGGTSIAAGANFTMVSANMTLYAQWTLIPTYTVTYNGNGNTGGTVPTDPGAYLTNATVTVLGNTGNLVKTGYTFSGWNTAADGSGSTYGASFTMGTSSVTLYAKWAINTYVITFNRNGGDVDANPTTESAPYQGNVVLPAPPTRSGYTFAGWNTATNGSGTAFNANTTVTASITVYAQWTLIVVPIISSATAGNNQVAVTWTAVNGATSYYLYYNSGATVDKTHIIAIDTVKAPAVTYTVTSLTNGTPYLFAVSAVTSGGESKLSTAVSATPEPPPPGAPSIAATAGDGTVTVTWAGVSGATLYNLYYAQNSTVSKSGTKLSSVTSPYVLKGLTDGKPYAVAVTAVNGGGESGLSNIATATPVAAPTISAATAGTGQVTITWGTIAGAASYNVYYAAGTTVDKTGSKGSFTGSPAVINGLTNGTKYAFAVSAANLNGESGLSAPATATPMAAPTISASAGDGKVTITGSAVTGATSYNLYYAAGTTVTKSGTKVSFTASPYTVSGLTNGTQYAFALSAANAGGESNLSSVATATPQVAPPKITSQPDSQAAPEGVTVKFTITASGSNITYLWQKNGVNIATGANAATYTTPTIALADNGERFRCIVTNAAGSDTSKNALLTVNAQAPTITTQPTSQTVTEGGKATFSLQATLNPTYQWYRNDTLIANATSASYMTPVTTMADSGSLFKCIVTHAGFSVTSSTVTLTVKMEVPLITKQPVSPTTAIEGATVSFSITATGTNLSYQWQKNQVNIAGANASTYITPPVTLADNGAIFRCIVSNGGGSVISTDALLIVNPAGPVILSSPSSTTVIEGNAATFTVSASGSNLTYQWQKNGSAITNATSSSYTTPATTLADSGATFQCVVTNPGGRVSSGTATLSVSRAAPKIIVQPASQAAPVGTSVIFSIKASGSNLTYQWQKNGVALVGAIGPNDTTAPITAADNNAKFLCVVSNSAGSVRSDTATLYVSNLAAVITQNPLNQTISAGKTAVFSVVASGPPGSNLTYQWQRNGAAVTGATAASYTTPPATRADSGATFSCVVSSSGLSVTSSSAILTVLTPQYNLRIAALGNGGLVSPDGNVTVSYGDSLHIKAIPLAYYRFDHWKTDSGTVFILDSFSASTSVISNWGNAAISANFVLSACTLSVVSAGHGQVAPASPIVTTIGYPTTIRAVADTGYHFDHWIGTRGNPFITDSTKDSTSVVLLGNAQVQAVFAIGTLYKVIVKIALSSDSTLTIMDTLVHPGDTVALMAPIRTSYAFVNWQVSGGSGVIIDSTNPAAKLVVNVGSVTVMAYYGSTGVITIRRLNLPSRFGLRFQAATGLVFFEVPPIAGKDRVPLRIRLFDVSGRLVRNIVETTMSPGYYHASLFANGSSRRLANQMDICVMESIGFRRSITVNIVR